MSEGQQGRELCGCGHGIEDHYRASAYCTSGWPGSSRCVCDLYRPALSFTPPARDSGRDEAREAVARWLWVQADGTYRSWGHPGYADLREHWHTVADELLALPELAAILNEPPQPPHSSR